jgi:hypothetical protein
MTMFNLATMKSLFQFSSLMGLQQLISARTINATMKVKPKDLLVPGNFKNRGVKKLAHLHGITETEAEQVYDCMIELSEREGIVLLNGLGGSSVRPVKDILAQYNLL